jgi:hypothetical protein
MSKSGWVIVRFFGIEQRYWDGCHLGSLGFSKEHRDAVRFAREQDAYMVLIRLLDGQGIVSKCKWLNPQECESALESMRQSVISKTTSP